MSDVDPWVWVGMALVLVPYFFYYLAASPALMWEKLFVIVLLTVALVWLWPFFILAAIYVWGSRRVIVRNGRY